MEIIGRFGTSRGIQTDVNAGSGSVSPEGTESSGNSGRNFRNFEFLDPSREIRVIVNLSRSLKILSLREEIFGLGDTSKFRNFRVFSRI